MGDEWRCFRRVDEAKAAIEEAAPKKPMRELLKEADDRSREQERLRAAQREAAEEERRKKDRNAGHTSERGPGKNYSPADGEG